MVGGLVASVFSAYWTRTEENGERLSFDVAAFEPLTEAHARLIQRLHDAQTELLRKLGVETGKEGRWVKRLGEKTPVFYARYKTKTGDSRVALVYDAALHRWPGTQPQTIVLADDQYRLIAWKEVGVMHAADVSAKARLFNPVSFGPGGDDGTASDHRLIRFR
jgi:hypothetical protein